DFLRKRVTKRNGPEATIFGSGPYAGKTLAQVAADLNKPFEDVLIDDIGPNGASAAYFVMDEELQNRLLLDSLVMVCSDGSPTGRHPRGHGTFVRIIEKFVVEKQLLTIEEAVYKMTGLTARSIGMNDRGILAEGKKADILIFDPNRVKETATFEDPFQLAEGMAYVFVNGRLVIEHSEISEYFYGRVLLIMN
ncbi:MAG: amidohydrolase family protein, partial [Bacteroidetes bacterium]|nr:amidohydrolase family protein [Bacteroidota bacterium]